MTGQLAERIRRYTNEAFIEPARTAGKVDVTVTAGDVHRDLKLKNRMPAICGALDAQGFCERYRVVLGRRTGPKQGATAKWYFSIEL